MLVSVNYKKFQDKMNALGPEQPYTEVEAAASFRNLVGFVRRPDGGCAGNNGRLKQGDRALAEMLAFHSIVMNGGVLHAVEVFDRANRKSAMEGYEYFTFTQVAKIIEDAGKILESGHNLEEAETRLNQAYWDIIPKDSVLYERFKEKYNKRPDQFSETDK